MNLKKQIFKLLILCIGFSLMAGNTAHAQLFGKKKKKAPKDAPAAVAKPKTYSDFITNNYSTQKGLFTVHKHKDTTYFEIPDSLLKRDIMVINRLTEASIGFGKYPGEEMNEKTIRFEIGPDSAIRLKYVQVYKEADAGSDIGKAVSNAAINATAYTFPLVFDNKANKSYLINVSKLFTEKSFINTVDPSIKESENIDDPKDFKVDYIHAYPINVEFGNSQTVNMRPTKLRGNLKMNISFIELPKIPMIRRYYDERIGYFGSAVYHFSDDQQKTDITNFIYRWRLEPRDADLEKWKRGELVEPQKPIVIYIDPAAPKQWHPYLIAGINDWQKAFEQAGFKNAIIGKEWPEHDTTMHMDDARYSFLNYFPSDKQNAYGPQVHDPRSGEIIQTHIGWYSNVSALLHDWYMIQAGAVDPKARRARFDDELMGQLIRFVSSHEVGHTLGLAHNFGSSSQTPVDSLRNKHYLDVHGHTASIMDYARFNYVAQPEDNIPEADIFPRIGEYDKWAIEWGYKRSGATNAEEDKKIVSQWADARLKSNSRLLWITGELPSLKFDPRAQTEDVGDNAVTASTYGIKNLQRVLPNLPAWTFVAGDNKAGLESAFSALRNEFYAYLGHVIKYVGGYYHTYKSEDQKEPVYTPVSKETIKQALSFFNEQLFKTPTWLSNTSVLDKVEGIDQYNFVNQMQVRVMNSLLDAPRMNKLRDNANRFGSDKTISITEYVALIHGYIWTELKDNKPIKEDSYRRNLQKTYFGAIQDLLMGEANSDAASILRADLFSLKDEIKKAEPRSADILTSYHFKDIELRIKLLLDTKASASASL